jgi:hypothetical protein
MAVQSSSRGLVAEPGAPVSTSSSEGLCGDYAPLTPHPHRSRLVVGSTRDCAMNALSRGVQ